MAAHRLCAPAEDAEQAFSEWIARARLARGTHGRHDAAPARENVEVGDSRESFGHFRVAVAAPTRMRVAIDEGGHEHAAVVVAACSGDIRGRVTGTNRCDATVHRVDVAALDHAQIAHGMPASRPFRGESSHRRLCKRENAHIREENLGRHAAIVADSGQSATVRWLLFAWLSLARVP